MNRKDIQATSNWNVNGCDLDKAIQIELTHEDVFIKPQLDDILSEDHAFLLTQPTTMEPLQSCELQVAIYPRFKIAAIIFVCSAPKIELFLGPESEYLETVYGILIPGETDEPHSYRYDIELEKSGVVEVNLKLLGPTNEICFFGIMIQIAPNPNGITTLLPQSINLDKVQQMLNQSSHKISPGAEKCKMFMQMYKSSTADTHSQASAASSSALLEQMRNVLGTKSPHTSGESHTLDKILKTHIDKRLQEMECRINKRLDTIVENQAKQFERVMKMLEDKK